ncbi:MAG: DUF2835 domain-containing protein [Pseudomonadota bacterium]
MRYRVHLAISASELARYYRGAARQVLAVDVAGRRVSFPAALLRPHVGHGGLQGWFELETDDQHRLRNFRRLTDGR